MKKALVRIELFDEDGEVIGVLHTSTDNGINKQEIELTDGWQKISLGAHNINVMRGWLEEFN